MAAVVHLDTYVVAWLFGRGAESLSSVAANRIEGADAVVISPMVRLELQYLHEIGRLGQPALPVLDALEGAMGLRMAEDPFTLVVREAEARSLTRDPFDRLIVAQAALRDSPLVTKDRSMHENYAHAVW